MTNRLKHIAKNTGFTLFDSPIWKIKADEFAKAVVKDCIEQIPDLKGYSGVGEDGDPYDTTSWNAALTAVEKMLIIRFELTDLKDHNERLQTNTQDKIS